MFSTIIWRAPTEFGLVFPGCWCTIAVAAFAVAALAVAALAVAAFAVAAFAVAAFAVAAFAVAAFAVAAADNPHHASASVYLVAQ